MKTTLEVRPEGQDKSVLTVPNANFEKGKYYTIVVTGHSKGMPKSSGVDDRKSVGRNSRHLALNESRRFTRIYPDQERAE